jgi:ABC-2 type transport system ATP-binding protein
MIYEASGRGLTIVVTTHYMDEAEYCDRLCIMVDGRAAALDRPEAMKQHYGAESMNEVFIQHARPNKIKHS